MPKKGYKPTPEHLEKLRLAKLGNKNNLGNKASKETKDKMSLAHKERYEDPEERRKTSEACKGVPKKSTENYHGPKSDLHKQHIRESLTDRPSTPEWNKKNSENRTGKGMGNINRLGKEDSDERKQEKREFIKGEKNFNWKGGITPLNIAIRQLPEYVSWRDAVFKRDNYKDVITGEGGEVEAHHNTPLAVMVELYNIKTIEDAINCKELWDVNNGITLTVKNHFKLHSEFGKDMRGKIQ